MMTRRQEYTDLICTDCGQPGAAICDLCLDARLHRPLPTAVITVRESVSAAYAARQGVRILTVRRSGVRIEQRILALEAQ